MIHNFSQVCQSVLSFDGALANSTQNGTAVNTLGYRRACVLVNTFTGAATTANFNLQESADGSTNWASVSGATLGSAIAASTADTGAYMIDVDLAKRKQYLRVQCIGTGTAGNMVATVLLLEPENTITISQAQTPIIV